MSEFTDFIDGLVDSGKILAKDELKKLIEDSKKEADDFVKMQAQNFERLTVALANKELTPEGYQKQVMQLKVLTDLEKLNQETRAKASAQRLADGLNKLVVDGLFKLIGV